MNDRGELMITGGPVSLLRLVQHAAVRASKEPQRTLLWPTGRLRLLVLAISVALTVGFTAGSIAIHIQMMGVRATPAWLLGVVQCGPLIVGARWPLVAWRISALGMFAGVLVLGNHSNEFWPWPTTSFLALAGLLFAVATAYDRRTSLGVGLITALGLIVPAIVIDGMHGWFGIILAIVVAIVLVFGDAVGGRYAAEASLAEQAELRRQDLARQAVLEERSRIAWELHDIVAHHMSVIALQAEAAPYKIPDLPPAARATFGVVRDAAREALAETRRVVGLLRQDSEVAERVPQPGLDRFEELTEQARRSGLDIDVTVVGMPRELSTGVDLSAYRIVQESLSNACRYAKGGHVRVEIRYGTEVLHVSVTDDGPRGTPEESGGGHGLVGMRERVAMLDGTLSAGPRPDHEGWAVAADLPYGEL
jgi:signal transduction histidine kinase